MKDSEANSDEKKETAEKKQSAAFVVSARKYRPISFETVVGQGSVTETLRNAILNNHLAHAYLFCGPRGVGKTTCARIFAKEINQHGTKEGADFSLNVFELDAASNNSVEDIRTLTDQVRVPPQVGKYRVFIIDEVHMLSQAAFNAFLKTLEEPPEHAVFVLATTEKHKIIPTILSRCQIFDFNRIQVGDMVGHLKKIASKEGVEAEEEALHVIAQKADGGLRDALSIFDQLVSFSGNKLVYNDVIEHLNVLDYDYFFKFSDAFFKQDISTALLLFDQVLRKGFDGHHFINGLASHFRDLLVCRDPQTVSLLEVAGNVKEKYLEYAKKFTPLYLVNGLKLLSKCDVSFKLSKNQRLLVEIALMELSQPAVAEEKKNSNRDVTPPAKKEVTPPANNASKVVENTVPVREASKVPTPVKSAENGVSPIKSAPSPAVQQKKAPVGAGRVSLNLSSTSINSILKGGGAKEEETEELSEEELLRNKPRTTYHQDQFMEAWKAYAQIAKDDGKLSFFTTMTAYSPELHDDFKVEVKLENKVQVHELDQERGGLLSYLRDRLNNYGIQLTYRMLNDGETKKQQYLSGVEKFKIMGEENPNLFALKEKLNLQIEY